MWLSGHSDDFACFSLACKAGFQTDETRIPRISTKRLQGTEISQDSLETLNFADPFAQD
jgi:hypothetical protein